MAVPKRKVSSARQNKRRSNVWKLSAPALMKCPQCGEYKTPHRVCGNCGYYNGREVVGIFWCRAVKQRQISRILPQNGREKSCGS